MTRSVQRQSAGGRTAAPRRIVISAGTVTGFQDEVSFAGLQLESFERKRVSHVVPAGPLKRLFFGAIRCVAGESTKLAAWTRTWRCAWLVLVDEKRYGPFIERHEAIAFEKQLIRAQGKHLPRIDQEAGA